MLLALPFGVPELLSRRDTLIAATETDLILVPSVTAAGTPSVDFEYLVGRPHENAVLAMTTATPPATVVLLAGTSPTKESWSDLGLDTTSDLALWVHRRQTAMTSASLPFESMQDVHRYRKQVSSLATFRDLGPTLSAVRSVKSPSEIQRIEAASTLTQTILCELRDSTRNRSALDLSEQIHRAAQAQNAPVSFDIALVGEDALQPHGPGDAKRQARRGDLVLFDVGTRHGGYSSDITRTFPVSRRFTKEQRVVYTLVREALLAAITQMQPGKTLRDARLAAERHLREGIRDLQIVDTTSPSWFSRLSPHGYFHFLGLEVHDRWHHTREQADSIVLKTGMVFAVEPGLYLAPPALLPSSRKRFAGIGVRLEENVLVEESGPRILSSACPTSIKSIESP